MQALDQSVQESPYNALDEIYKSLTKIEKQLSQGWDSEILLQRSSQLRNQFTEEFLKSMNASQDATLRELKLSEFMIDMDKEINVTYLDETTKSSKKLSVVDGKIFDADGKLLNTGRSIFVLGKDDNLYSIKDEKDFYHHSTFFGVDGVLFAGELKVKDGVITMISNSSGHFMPRPSDFIKFLTWLKKLGVLPLTVEIDVDFGENISINMAS